MEEKKERELDLIQVTSDAVDSDACGPESCPHIDCGTPST